MSQGLYELMYGPYKTDADQISGHSRDRDNGIITVAADSYDEAIEIAKTRLPSPRTYEDQRTYKRVQLPRYFSLISCTDTDIRKVIPDSTIIDNSSTFIGKIR